jgi:3-dehydroquinate synthase
MQHTVTFPSGTVNYAFQCSAEELAQHANNRPIVVVTDEHIAGLYPQLRSRFKTLTVPASENSKDIRTVEKLAGDLLQMEAGRNTLLVGIGGGVVTDITGFLASVYMRGVSFGFIPTTLLAMVDAAIGGKNGVNTGLHKNILGTISQPEFILYDTNFLKTLPGEEWSNGFAEIIKYACIFDAAMFEELTKHNIGYYQGNYASLSDLVEKCVHLKNKVVLADEREKHQRKLLNFGHTLAHAVEKLYGLTHGKAVAIGMVAACIISQNRTSLDEAVTLKLKSLLQQYGLPVRLDLNVENVMSILKMDKKRTNDNIDYILLEAVGKAAICPLPLAEIEHALISYERNH